MSRLVEIKELLVKSKYKDIIIATKAALDEEMATDAAWQNIEAVKNGKVEYLDSSYFGMSANLKVIEGLDILHDIVHSKGE